jgi:hypothetical protein
VVLFAKKIRRLVASNSVRSKSRYVLLNKEIRPEVLLRSFEDLVFTLKSGDGSAAKWWSQVVNNHFVFHIN